MTRKSKIGPSIWAISKAWRVKLSTAWFSVTFTSQLRTGFAGKNQRRKGLARQKWDISKLLTKAKDALLCTEVMDRWLS